MVGICCDDEAPGGESNALVIDRNDRGGEAYITGGGEAYITGGKEATCGAMPYSGNPASSNKGNPP